MTTPGSTDVLPRLREVFARRFHVNGDDIPADMALTDALGARYDSLTALEIVTAVENEFDIEVDFVTDDVRRWFSTLQLAAQFVSERREDAELLERN